MTRERILQLAEHVFYLMKVEDVFITMTFGEMRHTKIYLHDLRHSNNEASKIYLASTEREMHDCETVKYVIDPDLVQAEAHMLKIIGEELNNDTV